MQNKWVIAIQKFKIWGLANKQKEVAIMNIQLTSCRYWKSNKITNFNANYIVCTSYSSKIILSTMSCIIMLYMIEHDMIQGALLKTLPIKGNITI